MWSAGSVGERSEGERRQGGRCFAHRPDGTSRAGRLVGLPGAVAEEPVAVRDILESELRPPGRRAAPCDPGDDSHRIEQHVSRVRTFVGEELQQLACQGVRQICCPGVIQVGRLKVIRPELPGGRGTEGGRGEAAPVTLPLRGCGRTRVRGLCPPEPAARRVPRAVPGSRGNPRGRRSPAAVRPAQPDAGLCGGAGDEPAGDRTCRRVCTWKAGTPRSRWWGC